MNYLEILIGTVIIAGYGMIWYTIFKNSWLKAAQLKEMKMDAKSGLLMVIISAITATGMSNLIGMQNITSISEGALTGVLIGFFFCATVAASNVLWLRKKATLLFIDGLYYITMLAIVGAFVAWF